MTAKTSYQTQVIDYNNYVFVGFFFTIKAD